MVTTTHYNLNLPDHGEKNWDTPVNANFESIDGLLYGKQDVLVSGTSIKTINDMSLLGSGNIVINPSPDKDLSNLSSTGKNIANWSNNVTNCITEIPQDIKLELNNGTLTLKAGSKVYVPNGFEADGTTPKFDLITISSDLTYAYTGTNTGTMFIAYGAISSSIFGRWFAQVETGTSTPSTNYWLYYNTNDNICYDVRNTTGVKSSFPICAVTVLNNNIQSIDQVFNGFGYIGSMVFALPGVKGLIPNGRNDDGTLKNIEFTIDSVKTATRTWVDSNGQVWGYIKNPPAGATETWYWNKYIESDEEPSYNEYVMWYKPSENITYVNNELQSSTPNWEKVNYINFGKASGINSQEIKIFTPKTAFHALDYNDSSTISGWSMPSDRSIDLTLGASGASYTAPANGKIYWRKKASAVRQYIALIKTTNSRSVQTEAGVMWAVGANDDIYANIEVRKGEVFRTNYTADGSSAAEYLRFVYAEGEQ